MNIFTKTILLKKKHITEKNILYSFVSKELGYIDVIAFGANSISKRFKSSLDYFKVIEIEVSKDKNNYYTLKSVKNVLEIYNDLSKNIDKFFLASFVIELTSLSLHNSEKISKNNKNYFDIINNTLNYINFLNNNELNKIEFALKYSLKLFKETGFIDENTKISKNTNIKNFIYQTISKIPKSIKYI